jgi:hypothetical protein
MRQLFRNRVIRFAAAGMLVGLAAVCLTYVVRQNDLNRSAPMSSTTLGVEPFSLPLGDVQLSAVIRPNEANQRWDVTVVISRAPGLPLMRADEVDAQLIDAQNQFFKVLARPTGLLVSAGGSLSESSNAVFQFQATQNTPAQLNITYHGQPVHFRLNPKAAK